MSGQNENSPMVCPKCSANLIGGRDLPGCWRCGWEDYSQPGTGTAPLIGSSMSEPARYRPERGGGLDVGLALLLGIEPGEGELP